MAATGERTRVERLKQVGNYAVGVDWGDGHESIIPHRTIRLACPCDACEASPPTALAPDAERPARLELLGDASLFVRFADGHETLLLTEELRALCACAYCAGEPQYPISGR
jgi:DUF971 family protein